MVTRSTRSSRSTVDSTVYDIVADVRRDVAALRFPLDTSTAADARHQQALLLAQLDDHLLPRLAQLSRPAVIVVAGSTGAGKSTLVNSLVGRDVTRASVIRPTTTTPVLVLHPDDERLMVGSALLTEAEVTFSEDVPRGLAILDAPDLDSVRDDNRTQAIRLLESADLWLFVTTAQRYGDALPWKTLTSAAERGTSVALIVNRVPEDTTTEIYQDVTARLADHKMDATPIFMMKDHSPHTGPLPASDVKEVTGWLATLAGADHARTVIVRTLRGALDALPPRLNTLAAAVEDQAASHAALNESARDALVDVVESARKHAATGQYARGRLTAAWGQTAAAARFDKLINRSGYARVLRSNPTPPEALQQLKDTAITAAHELASDTIVTARRALAQLAHDDDAATIIDVAHHPVRTGHIATAVDTWVARISDDLAPILADHSKQSLASERAVTRDGLVTITLYAALGVPQAGELLERLIGFEAAPLAEITAVRLADTLDKLILDEYTYVTHTLDALGLDEDTATRLRLRAAELAQLRG